MKFRMLFALAALALASMAFAQPGGYLPNNVSFELSNGCPAGVGGCIADGALIEIKWDQNNNGTADYATDPLATVGTGLNQIMPFNTYLMNGGDLGLGCGYFYFLEPVYAQGSGNPTPNAFYFVVHGTGSAWVSATWGFPSGGGFSDIEPASWTCYPVVQQCVQPAVVVLVPGQLNCFNTCQGHTTTLIADCPADQPPLVVIDGVPVPPNAWVYVGGHWEYTVTGVADNVEVCARLDGCSPPPCIPTPLVQFFANRENGVPNYYCADLCVNQPTVIRVCNYTLGEPLNPANTPIVTLTPGCDDLSTGCQRVCEPGMANLAGLIPYTAWTYVGGCFEITIFGVDNGCVCVGLEGFLAGVVSEFTATALDNSVDVNFATVSETNLSRFEVTRTVKGHEAGEVVAILNANNTATGATYHFVDATAINGTSYVYSLSLVNLDGSVETIDLTAEATPSYNAAVITEYALHQNFPNPFNPTTQITFDLVENNLVNLKVYNVNGQLVDELVNGNLTSGRHTLTFDSKNLTSGLYFYTVKIGNEFTATKKMMLVK